MKEPKKNKLADFFQKESVAGYVFILPFLIGLFAFTLIPMVVSLGLSFTNYDILSPPKFAGIENYIRMFTNDKVFWKSFRVTIYYAIVSVPLKLIMALFVAMLFVKTTKVTSFYRAIYYLPSIMGGSVAVAILWKQLFAGNGVINALLSKIGLPSDIGWLSNAY